MTHRLIGLIFLAGAVALLAGCGTVTPKAYEQAEPRFVLEDYFLGKTKAWGIFEDRKGQVQRQFVVEITGTMDGDELVLTEDFVYADGEVSQRIWRVRRIDEHRYEGRADDVDGVATGESYGNALYWSYILRLPVGDDVYNVRFDDWMFLQPDGVLLNRARMSKFGIHLGEVTIAFQKVE